MRKKEELKNKIREAIEKNPFKKNIQRVSVFGSYVYGSPKSGSDVDVLIEFTPTAKVGFFRLAQIQRNIEGLIKKPVDLLTPEALSKLFKKEIIKKSEVVYER